MGMRADKRGSSCGGTWSQESTLSERHVIPSSLCAGGNYLVEAQIYMVREKGILQEQSSWGQKAIKI